jgi:hypothetical protein
MIIHNSRHGLVLLVCFSLVFSPLIRAAQLSLPAADLVAPKITQEHYVDTVEKNKNHKISVTVKDNVKVKQVILYYRVIGSKNYKTKAMQNKPNTNQYIATIYSKEISSPGVEYYIQAADYAGNTLLHGYSFSPLSVKTISASTAIAASETNPSTKPKDEDDDDSIFSNKWLWIGLGVLALGAAASGGSSGGGGGTPTATLTINTAEPVQ